MLQTSPNAHLANLLPGFCAVHEVIITVFIPQTQVGKMGINDVGGMDLAGPALGGVDLGPASSNPSWASSISFSCSFSRVSNLY